MAGRRWRTTVGVALWVAVGAGGAFAQGAKALDAMTPEEREQVEQRVGEMEADMRARRDAALVRCRGSLANCQTKTCGKVPEAQTGTWQQCQENCERSYQTCLSQARAIWPDE
jgi:hypothetical protein